jgi:hypothetical protein
MLNRFNPILTDPLHKLDAQHTPFVLQKAIKIQYQIPVLQYLFSLLL